MTSKITDAIKQLYDSSLSLTAAVLAVHDTINEKVNQIEQLRIQYVKTHMQDLSGVWNLNLHNDTDYVLRGWKYTDKYWESKGDEKGDALSSALRISSEDGEYISIIIQHEGESNKADIVISFHSGDIEICFYNFTRDEMFSFLKENDITVKLPHIDEEIVDLKQRLETLCDFKAIIVSNNLSSDTKPYTAGVFDSCKHYDGILTGIEVGCHPPL